MKDRFDVVIIGAGMVGLTIANLLAQSEHTDRIAVTVIDAAGSPAYDSSGDVALRVSAISPGSAAILQSVGAWQTVLQTRTCAFHDMCVWDAGGSHDGPETLRFEAAEFAMPQLGFITENVLVRTALLKELVRTDARVIFDAPVESLGAWDQGITVNLADGRKLRPHLLVGADGARSIVRRMAGIDTSVRSHEQKALVTHLSPARSHRYTAWQRFLPDGPLGILPLADGRVSIVWSTTRENADSALELSDEELSRAVTEASDGVLGSLSVAGSRGVFPLVSQHAASYVAQGLALAGDAAHSIHPLAGQGANLGFADAAELADVVIAALDAEEHPGDLPVLRKYERARKGANRSMLHFLDGMNRLFSNESEALARLRGMGMFLFNHSGPVREFAVRHALGIR